MEYLLQPEEVSATEAIIRQRINFSFRLLIALFVNYQIFDFLYSPIWIHGYICVSGFRNNNRTVWQLLQLSIIIGVLTATLRCLQIKQRLYSAIHEGFYAYLLTFFTGLILTLQVSERITASSMEEELEKATSIVKSNLATETKKLL
uniref:Pecanex-like protein n=1 Tax=Elaeophora elaphi TaxID=1147741 RepID=A0A0R3S2Z5_9BILA